MKINGFSGIKSNYLKNGSKVHTDTKTQDKSKIAGQAGDKVEISKFAIEARNIALDNNKFSLRIDNLKTAVENGKYKINADKIAQLLLDK